MTAERQRAKLGAWSQPHRPGIRTYVRDRGGAQGWLRARDPTLIKVPTVARVKAARQRLVLCRLVFDVMRSLHGAYAPRSEPFGTRLETFFIGLCVALGQLDGRPFSIAKIAGYMRVPRTTVMRRLKRLETWGLIYRAGGHYFVHEAALNSLMGLRSYQQIRRILSTSADELTVLDALPE